MTATTLSTLAQLNLGIAALCCLSLAMERHARQAGAQFQYPRMRTGLRWAGWTLLALALFIAVATTGWGFGLVYLFGVLSAATVVVIALITYWHRWLVPAPLVCAVSGSVLMGFYVFL